MPFFIFHFTQIFSWFRFSLSSSSLLSSMPQVKAIAPKGLARHPQGEMGLHRGGGPGRGTKRKMTLHPTLGYAIPPPIAPKVARRNARERNRVKQVNCGFEILRNQIPTAAKHKKMSKVDTLRHAVDYIRHLKQMLNDDIEVDDAASTDIKSEVSDDIEDKELLLSPNNSFPQTLMTQQQPQLQSLHPQSSVLMSPTSITTDFAGQTSSQFDRLHFFNSQYANLISPLSDQVHPNIPVQTQGFTHPQGHLYRGSTPNSVETSPSVYSDTSAFFTPQASLEPASAQHNYFYSDCLDPNSEEDELLDAIVKWQED